MAVRVAVTRSNQIDPDPRVERLSSALSRGGYAVTIVGWDRSGILSRFEIRKYGKIRLLPIRAGFGRGIGNLPQLVRWQLGLLFWLFRNRKEYDVIHACDFDTVLPALLVAGIWQKPLVYDIFDFYADMLRSTPRPIRNAIRVIDLLAITKSDAVILADRARIEQLAGRKPEKLALIYNTPEDRSHDIWASKADVRHDGEFRIAFIGLLQVERGLQELLDIFASRREWILDLAGYGGDEGAIVSRAKSLPNVRFHGRIPHLRALELTDQADALVATYDPRIPNHRYASPNKLFEAMMLAKPIVVARGTNMDRIVEANGCGLVVEYGNTTDLEAALSRLANEPVLRSALGAAGRSAYERHYNWEEMERRLINLYQQL